MEARVKGGEGRGVMCHLPITGGIRGVFSLA